MQRTELGDDPVHAEYHGLATEHKPVLSDRAISWFYALSIQLIAGVLDNLLHFLAAVVDLVHVLFSILVAASGVHGHVNARFHQLQVGLEQGGAAITLSQRCEAAELIGKLRRTVGTSLFEVIDAKQAVVIKRGLPHMRFKALIIWQRRFPQMIEKPHLVFVPKPISAVGSVGYHRQLKANLGEDVDIVCIWQVQVVPKRRRVNVAIAQCLT
jgi:hypothetical protein